MVSIFMADDHVMVREALEVILANRYEDLNFRGVGSLPALVSELDEKGDANLIILDLKIPGMNGTMGLRHLLTRHPNLPVMYLSGSYTKADVSAAMKLGVLGFVSKTSSRETICAAIDMALRGEKFVVATIFDDDDENVSSHRVNSPLGQNGSLTPRERDVLTLLTEGLTNKEIGRRMNIADTTVKVHFKAIFRKLGVANRAQALRIALDYSSDFGATV